jgi:centrosomal protein CEP41
MALDGDLPYLLLDIRDRDEYAQCHIISSLNYPAAMLSRSVNNETKELLAYKNQAGKIIVIYDDDERIAPKAATTLIQRGYDNLFMLSGGLKLAARKFPEGLITGTLPQQIKDANLKDIKAPKPKAQLAEIYGKLNGLANKTTFNSDDIEKLNSYLELVLLPNDPTSRLSRATKLTNSNSSRTSSISNLSNISKATSIHSQPWKPV